VAAVVAADEAATDPPAAKHPATATKPGRDQEITRGQLVDELPSLFALGKGESAAALPTLRVGRCRKADEEAMPGFDVVVRSKDEPAP
jgi:hypothetical protein